MGKGTIHRDEGIVLRTYKLGEADRIVVFLTKARGKVRAVAKGVRKTKSKFGSRLEPMSHCVLQFYEGRELDIVTQAESIDNFRAVREDLDRIGRGVSMLEVADQLAQEGEVNPQLYRMLLGALRTLETSTSPLVTPAFYWKVLALEGYRPEVEV
jgi:DNA repair protein RecO (recombination protein O)